MIENIKVDGAVLKLGPGAMLALSEQQAAARAKNIKKIGDGVYEATGPMEFKSGEQLGVRLDDVPKHLLAFVEVAEGKSAAAAKAEAKQASKSKAKTKG